MKNQKGFTLVELMVVMAIIAILSTAGISQYGKFIKNSRDSARLENIKALKTVITETVSEQGTVPDDVPALISQTQKITGKYIDDPISGKEACLNQNNDTIPCHFEYSICDGGTGYVLSAVFENTKNIKKYSQDDVSSADADTILDPNKYEIGNCDILDYGPDIISWEAGMTR